MTEEEIVKQVKAIIVDKLGVEESEVTESANFTNDLGADSLDTVELLMEFERVFGTRFLMRRQALSQLLRTRSTRSRRSSPARRKHNNPLTERIKPRILVRGFFLR